LGAGGLLPSSGTSSGPFFFAGAVDGVAVESVGRLGLTARPAGSGPSTTTVLFGAVVVAPGPEFVVEADVAGLVTEPLAPVPVPPVSDVPAAGLGFGVTTVVPAVVVPPVVVPAALVPVTGRFTLVAVLPSSGVAGRGLGVVVRPVALVPDTIPVPAGLVVEPVVVEEAVVLATPETGAPVVPTVFLASPPAPVAVPVSVDVVADTFLFADEAMSSVPCFTSARLCPGVSADASGVPSGLY